MITVIHRPKLGTLKLFISIYCIRGIYRVEWKSKHLLKKCSTKLAWEAYQKNNHTTGFYFPIPKHKHVIKLSVL